MTTLLPTPTDSAVDDAAPGCGCCIPPPGGDADRAKALAELQARRDAIERRLAGLHQPNG
jgi:hypothetical protein